MFNRQGEIANQIVESLVRKAEDASRRCPPGILISDKRFQHMVQRIRNYKEARKKIREENYHNFRSGDIVSFDSFDSRIYGISNRYDPLVLSQEIRRRRLVS